jgi:hypothetical protein
MAPVEYTPFYVDPADDAEHASWNADDDGRDFDFEVDDAAAIDAHERGLIFA